MARSSGFALARNCFSTVGMICSSKSSENDVGLRPGGDTAPDKCDAWECPNGITTIMGFALCSAIKLSRMKLARPMSVQSFSFCPEPWSR